MALVQVKTAQQRTLESSRKGKNKPKVRENEIEVTYEYDVFERLPGNRPIDENWVIHLMKRMKKKDLKTPIQINQNFEVIDGQHRLEARQRLKFPVYYYVAEDYGLEEVQELNAQQKKWTIDDFVKSYIELGKTDYRTYQWYRYHYNIPHSQSVQLLAGHGDNRKSRHLFTSGEFKVNDLDGAKRTAEMLIQIQPYFDHWNNGRFVQAMMQVMRKKNFDFKKFLKKLKLYPTILKPQVSMDAYLQHLEDIYNYKAVNKVAIRYGEDK